MYKALQDTSLYGVHYNYNGHHYETFNSSLHIVTSRNVAGSIPDEVIEFFNWANPSSRTMTLWSTQPLTEMSTRNLLGGKGEAGA
jgi:hypothetical protein